MKSGIDWAKWGAIATIFSVVLYISVTALSYIRPPDANHPVSLDFFSKSVTVTVPLWLLILLGISLFLSAALAARQYLAFRKPSTTGTSLSGASEPVKLPHDVKSAGSQSASPTVNINDLMPDGSEQLVISSGDRVDVRIRREEFGGPQKGLILHVINNKLCSILSQQISITHAVSFDQHVGAYRQEQDFKPFVVVIPDILRPSCVSNIGIWIIRSEPSTSNLLVGNNSSSEIIWPNVDNSSLHKWKLSLRVESAENQTSAKAESFGPIKFDLVVIWNKDNNNFFIEKQILAQRADVLD